MALANCPQCAAEVPRRANHCPNCGAVLRETLPPQTSGGSDVFALVGGVVAGLFGAILLSRIPGEAGSPLLRVSLGVLGLMLPSAAGLAWANRGRIRPVDGVEVDGAESGASSVDRQAEAEQT